MADLSLRPPPLLRTTRRYGHGGETHHDYDYLWQHRPRNMSVIVNIFFSEELPLEVRRYLSPENLREILTARRAVKRIKNRSLTLKRQEIARIIHEMDVFPNASKEMSEMVSKYSFNSRRKSRKSRRKSRKSRRKSRKSRRKSRKSRRKSRKSRRKSRKSRRKSRKSRRKSRKSRRRSKNGRRGSQKYENCVQKVKSRQPKRCEESKWKAKGCYNPWAICTKTVGRFGMTGNSVKNLGCNRPRKSWRPGKKRVVRACSGGKSKIIHYGATGYGHNYSAAARRSFRARHKCSTAKNKLTARYWACKNLWTKGGSKQECPRGRICKN